MCFCFCFFFILIKKVDKGQKNKIWEECLLVKIYSLPRHCALVASIQFWLIMLFTTCFLLNFVFQYGWSLELNFFLLSLVASIALLVTSKATSGDTGRTNDYALKTGGALETLDTVRHFVKGTQSHRFQLFTWFAAGKSLKQSTFFYTFKHRSFP